MFLSLVSVVVTHLTPDQLVLSGDTVLQPNKRAFLVLITFEKVLLSILILLLLLLLLWFSLPFFSCYAPYFSSTGTQPDK